MKTISIILFSAVIFLFCSACHERGCTNKDAINFNVTADEDDGSCIVCQTTESKMDSLTVELKDKNFSSPHYNQNVARFYLYQYTQTPNDKVCGKETSTITLAVQSLVNQKMYLPFRLTTFSGPVNVFYDKNTIINANEAEEFGLIETFNNPPFLGISLDSIFTDATDDIIYY